MLEQTVAAYTFSKSFSMSGWRLGFAVSSLEIIDVFGKLTNSALSCVPPFTQMAGVVAMRDELGYRDAKMKEFQKKVELLVAGMNKIDGVSCAMPGGTFYVFPSVAGVCNRSASRRTAWRSIYWKARTTRAASHVWVASASAMPAGGSCASAARSLTSASRKRSRSWPRRSSGRIAWMRISKRTRSSD